MTPADELRQAAATLRKLAAKARPGPWTVDDRGDVLASGGLPPDGLYSYRYALNVSTPDSDYLDPGIQDREDATWIATMSPDLADSQAEILESTYYAIENGRCEADRLAPVLRFARRINKANQEATR